MSPKVPPRSRRRASTHPLPLPPKYIPPFNYFASIPDPYHAPSDILADSDALSPPRDPARTNPKPRRNSNPRSPSKFLFTPADIPPIVPSRCTTASSFPARKSVSSPLLHPHPLTVPIPSPSSSPPPYSALPPPPPILAPLHPRLVSSDTDDDEEEEEGDDAIYTSWPPSSPPPPHPSSSRLAPSSSNDRLAPSSSSSRLVPSSSSSTRLSHSASSSTTRLAPPPSTSARPAPNSSSSSLRLRIFGAHHPSRDGPAQICTTPGQHCAGETETETDEPPQHLPTSRLRPSLSLSSPLSLNLSPNPSSQTPTFLFTFSRLLSVVPALLGAIYNLYHIARPPIALLPSGRAPPGRVDFFVSFLWALLTAYQCLSLSTGLLLRWQLYYPPLPTLIRLLALQGICWPATHLTLSLLGAETRPALVWAVVGSTTCVSRSVQIWVTSNLWWDRVDGANPSSSPSPSSKKTSAAATDPPENSNWQRLHAGGKWGGRRWDWPEVGLKCVLPAGIVYFIMAWAELLQREWVAAQGAAEGRC